MRDSPRARLRGFRRTIWRHYRENGRHELPWRKIPRSLSVARRGYRIFVAEMMLQQTPVARVERFYSRFVRRFPDFRSLARASLRDVLAAWSGLGYNRRALYAKRAAARIVREHRGVLPRDPEALRRLPGVGPGTAGSLAAFAYDAPVAFIETNIRRAFIHHFYPRRRRVSDGDILPLIEATVPRDRAQRAVRPREWYAALMDYGSALGARRPRKDDPNRRSAHYMAQSRFAGSDREARGRIVRTLLCRPAALGELAAVVPDRRQLCRAVTALAREGCVENRNGRFSVVR